MELNPASNIQSIASTTMASVKPPAVRATQEPAAFEHADALDQRLAQTPDVRPEFVKQAKNWVSLSSYPPPETLDRIARLLAMHIESGQSAFILGISPCSLGGRAISPA